MLHQDGIHFLVRNVINLHHLLLLSISIWRIKFVTYENKNKHIELCPPHFFLYLRSLLVWLCMSCYCNIMIHYITSKYWKAMNITKVLNEQDNAVYSRAKSACVIHFPR